nr:hypothetical protein GCM10020093_083940 [Planobispora longispora]
MWVSAHAYAIIGPVLPVIGECDIPAKLISSGVSTGLVYMAYRSERRRQKLFDRATHLHGQITERLSALGGMGPRTDP